MKKEKKGNYIQKKNSEY